MSDSGPTKEPKSILHRPPGNYVSQLRGSTPRERRLLVGAFAVLGRPVAFFAYRQKSLRALALVELTYDATDAYLLDRQGIVTVETVVSELEEAIPNVEIFAAVVDGLRG